MVASPKHIAVVALRRSGTTALWNLLRQDRRYTCYDEPFSRLLHDLPAENQKRTRAEFIALYNRDPQRFRDLYAPISRGEEVTREFSEGQVQYLQYLLDSGPVAFDVTRCMGKIRALHEAASDAVLVHLFRHPVAFASSHLQPSDSFDPFGLRKSWNHRTALQRKRRFNGWGMEELTRGIHFDATAALLSEAGVSLPKLASNVPAFHRLLAIWLGAFRLAESEGRECYGDQFMSLSFEELCSEPAVNISQIQDLAGIARLSIDSSWLKPASRGLRPDSEKWAEGARSVGFSADEMARFFPNEAA